MENRAENREKLFEKFLEYENSNSKKDDKHNSKKIELTVRQTNWLNLLIMLLCSFLSEYMTNNISFLQSYSLFSYLFECVIIGIIILRLIDEFAFKEIDTFANWNESPIAKSIYISAVTISIAIIILATSGTIVFRPNVIETETNTKPSTEIRHEQKQIQSSQQSKNGYDSIEFNSSTKED